MGISYWIFISFLWWYDVCLIIHYLCSLALVSVHLKEQTLLPRLYRLVWTGKDTLLLVPWADGIIFGIIVVLDWSQVMKLLLGPQRVLKFVGLLPRA